MSGEHRQAPYFINTADPNLLAYAAQHALLGVYPTHHKNLYPQQNYASPQMTPLMMPTQMLPQMVSSNPRSRIPSLTSAAIPDMDKLSLEEPIEAGNLPYRRANKSTSVSGAEDSFSNLHRSSSSSHIRRHSAQWETMTDDEREMIQRQKRKEEAFKTALCDAYKRAGTCPYGDSCRFAHGENELRMPSQPRGKAHPKYKTQLCDKFSTYGQCPYGPRCQFIHKLKKGLPLLEYNRALTFGEISPARDDEITNPDESSDQSGPLNLTRTVLRRRSSNFLDMSDSGYSGSSRRRLQHHQDQFEEPPRAKSASSGKIVYPPMQVVNIEMATGQKKSSSTASGDNQNQNRRASHHQQMPSVINQADYEASMASGKIFAKPENIRTYGAMIRANEEHVERNQTGAVKKDRVKVQTKKDLSLIREEDTLLVEGSQLHASATSAAPTIATTLPPPSNSNGAGTAGMQGLPWYEKIFGKKMTMIKEESVGEEEDEDDDGDVILSFDDADYSK
uniref:C3H1-type domain-containing protein n=2 Tax=Caenorhabditis japonica TaxID=281687 RepID=A0A8R1HTY1_CAEJA